MDTLKKIKKWMDRSCNSFYFEIDDENETNINYISRQHGNVGDEEPGQEDIDNAYTIKRNLMEMFNGEITIEIETVDEWVDINIELLKQEEKIAPIEGDNTMNPHGVFENPTVALEYKDKHLDYTINKARYRGKEYFASDVTVSCFGIYSGQGGPVTMDDKSYEDVLNHIKQFIQRYADKEPRLKDHLKKVPIFMNQDQLELF